MAIDAFTAAQHFMRNAIIGKKHTDSKDHTADVPKPKSKRKPRAKVTGQKIMKEQVDG